MFELSHLFALLTFALIACGTPGPNNLILTLSGAQVGFRRTIPLLIAVVGGISFLIGVQAFGVGVMLERWPVLHDILKVAGSAYLLLLAVQIGRSGAPDHSERPLVSPLRGFGLQLLNPKAWIMGISVISSFTLSGAHYWGSVGVVLTILFSIGLVTGAMWVKMGAWLGAFIKSERGWRYLNGFLGLMTAATVPMIWM